MLFLHLNYSEEYCSVLKKSFLTRPVMRRVQDVQNTRASTYQRAPVIEKRKKPKYRFFKNSNDLANTKIKKKLCK